MTASIAPARAGLLDSLIASRAITAEQAVLLAALWPNINVDAFAHPVLRTVREHTRAYLETGAG